MKTKKVSRVLALLLSLAMLLGALPTAFAESSIVTSEAEYEAMAQAAAEELYARLMGSTKYTVMQVELGDIVDEQLNNIMLRLDEEERSAYEAYVIELYQKAIAVNNVPIGPFKPAVDVSAQVATASTYSLLRSGTMLADTTDNGLEVRKTIEPDEDNLGQYTVMLEVWTTGTVKQETTTTPVDFVLVLDQSSSMTGTSFSSSNGGGTYQAGLAAAVETFIADVVEKYDSDTADHRISIVTFNNTSSGSSGGGGGGGSSNPHTEVVQDWTYADAVTNFSDVQTALDNSSYVSQGTRSDLGMELAVEQMGSGYSYNGENTTRQKVVIMFSDGVPSTSGSTSYTTSYADTAISYAKKLKDAGCTVYSVGVFEDADPSELYGTTSASGTAGSEGYSWKSDYAAAGNRYLNYLSSNSSDAADDGLNVSGDNTKTYKITKNYAWSNNGYYQKANSIESLKSVFKSISENISTSAIDLGANTIIRDIVAPTFELPNGTDTSQIEYYYDDYIGSEYTGTDYEKSAFKGKRVAITSGMTPVISTATKDGTTVVDVTVSGFNFNDNCITEKDKNKDEEGKDPDFGRKLIIEFPIKTKAGFLGGNNIPTNGENSGVYQNKDALNGSALENFPMNYVNMPVITPSVELTDKYVYLLDDVSFEQMYPYNSTMPGAATNCIIVYDTYNNPIALDITKANGGLAEWQTKYANLAITLSDTTGHTDLTADEEFEASVAITVGSTVASIGERASSQSASDEATIYVFKPEITFADSSINYLADANATDYTYYAANNYKLTEWVWTGTDADGKQVSKKSTDEDVTMTTAKAPDIELTYSPNGAAWITDGKVTSTVDVPVNVTAMIGTTDISGYTTSIRKACGDCLHELSSGMMDDVTVEFIVHIKNVYGKLIVEKTGLKTGESAIFNVEAYVADGTASGTKKEWTIVLTGGTDGKASQTLTGLLVGSTYEVTEDNGWTWGYEDNETVATGQINALTATTATATLENTKTEQWLYDESIAVNEFDGDTTN